MLSALSGETAMVTQISRAQIPKEKERKIAAHLLEKVERERKRDW